MVGSKTNLIKAFKDPAVVVGVEVCSAKHSWEPFREDKREQMKGYSEGGK